MAIDTSKTQIDRLGDRLRRGEISETDLRLLDEYRRSFGGAYEFVVGAVRTELGLDPTGRPAKSTISISEKLVRESIRLTQVQDIAGCRLVIPSILDQNRICESLTSLFNNTTIVDRREKPSHGYRAVHAIVKVEDKAVEIQVRTSLQHVWAELSEKLADVVDPAIKYGGGDESLLKLLKLASTLVLEEETAELLATRNQERLSKLIATHSDDPEKRKTLVALQQEVQEFNDIQTTLKERVFETLRRLVDELPIPKGESDAVSD